MNFTLSPFAMFAFRKMPKSSELNFFSSEIQFLFISIYFHAVKVIAWSALTITCAPSYAWAEVIIFRLRKVACDFSVSFLNACYVGFGAVFFYTCEEFKPLINLSGSPQGYQRRTSTWTTDSPFLICMHASTRPQHSCRSVHSAAIVQ